jgi:hypothetical protein
MAKETATSFGYRYPDDHEQRVRGWIADRQPSGVDVGLRATPTSPGSPDER